jgi:hypothetical protein
MPLRGMGGETPGGGEHGSLGRRRKRYWAAALSRRPLLRSGAMRRQVILGVLAMAVAATVWGQGTTTGPMAGNTSPAGVAAREAVDVPVTRVVLFSSGVGYFEHNGEVTGSVTADLRFETAQINDVLKSLVVFDRGGGSVRTITYPSNDPVSRTLRSFQVNLSGEPTMADILKQMRGAAIAVTVADETIRGTILGVEQKEKGVGLGQAEKVVKTWVANIITETGIRSVSLDDVRKLEVLDEKIRKEMNQALAALVQARDQSKKTVTVHFDGAPRRSVGMGYLVETPVWKTTYRLMLPEATSRAPAELQAWAIVENQTDNDWKDVSLSLVGGRPISFIELLYQPTYVSRPVLGVTVAANIVPQTYDNGIAAGTNPLQAMGGNLGVQLNGGFLNLGRGATNNQGGLFGNNAGGNNFRMNNNFDGNFQVQTGGALAEVAPMTDFTQGVAAIAEATKIGEMFHYTVDKVTLPRQQSSMIPIVAEGVAVERLSIFSQAYSSRYAMRGLRLHNRTGKYLLGGPVTVMDTVKEGHSYAGDAKIEDIPAGQSRLLSYALDQDAVVQVSKDKGDEALLTGSVVKGVLTLKYRSQLQKEYTLQNKSENAKTIIIESPVTDGFDLKVPEKATEKTDKVYRLQVPLGPRESKTVPVILERTRMEELAIVSMKEDPLGFYLKQGAIPEKVREVLTTVAAKRGGLAELERQKAQREADRTQILQEQANIRENIRVLPAGSKSQEEAINKLGARETSLEAANKELKELQAGIEGARADLNRYLENANVE